MCDFNPTVFQIKFFLLGNIISKKNGKQIFINRKTNKRFPSTSDKFKDWHRTAVLQIKSQMHGYVMPISKTQAIVVKIYYGALHDKDNTNVVESVHDLLVDCGVLKDDNWKVLPDTRQIGEYRKGEPGCEIFIRV